MSDHITESDHITIITSKNKHTFECIKIERGLKRTKISNQTRSKYPERELSFRMRLLVLEFYQLIVFPFRHKDVTTGICVRVKTGDFTNFYKIELPDFYGKFAEDRFGKIYLCFKSVMYNDNNHVLNFGDTSDLTCFPKKIKILELYGIDEFANTTKFSGINKFSCIKKFSCIYEFTRIMRINCICDRYLNTSKFLKDVNENLEYLCIINPIVVKGFEGDCCSKKLTIDVNYIVNKFKKLKHLHIRYFGSNRPLTEVKDLKYLESLSLGGDGITDKLIIKDLPKLKILKLNHCYINKIQSVIRENVLKKLYIVCDLSKRIFERLFELDKLELLTIHGNCNDIMENGIDLNVKLNKLRFIKLICNVIIPVDIIITIINKNPNLRTFIFGSYLFNSMKFSDIVKLLRYIRNRKDYVGESSFPKPRTFYKNIWSRKWIILVKFDSSKYNLLKLAVNVFVNINRGLDGYWPLKIHKKGEFVKEDPPI